MMPKSNLELLKTSYLTTSFNLGLRLNNSLATKVSSPGLGKTTGKQVDGDLDISQQSSKNFTEPVARDLYL